MTPQCLFSLPYQVPVIQVPLQGLTMQCLFWKVGFYYQSLESVLIWGGPSVTSPQSFQHSFQPKVSSFVNNFVCVGCVMRLFSVWNVAFIMERIIPRSFSTQGCWNRVCMEQRALNMDWVLLIHSIGNWNSSDE